MMKKKPRRRAHFTCVSWRSALFAVLNQRPGFKPPHGTVINEWIPFALI